jgi:hypothetical protein
MEQERSDAAQRERRMTVVHVQVHADHAEVMFGESARVYRLARNNPSYENSLHLIERAAARGRSLTVRFVEPHGEVIERVYADDR